MKLIFPATIMLLLILASNALYAQDVETGKVLTLNFINPGIDYETPLGRTTTFALNLGIGYGDSYPHLSYSSGSGFVYLIVPFADLQARRYYNLDKRKDREKPTRLNSGNFYGLRLLSRGKEFEGNIARHNDLDFAFGPTWDLHRAYNRINLLFDIGPIIYWDKDDAGFFPLTFEINAGYILTKK